MGLPESFAEAIARLPFHTKEQPQLTRKQCAAFGALVYFGCAMLALLLFLTFLICVNRPDHFTEERATQRAIRVTFDAVHLFLTTTPVLALFGALCGLLRYQMKCGSELERACNGMLIQLFRPEGGHWFQMLMATPLMFIYAPLAFLALPVELLRLLTGSEVFGADGANPYVALLGGLLTTAVAFLATIGTSEAGSASFLVFATSVCAADPLLTWLIFRWHALGFLAVPKEAALPLRFSVRSLLLAVLGLGAYLTLLANLFDW